MSFMLTTAQILDRSKTVTRRLNWLQLKVGDKLWAVDRCMGLKKGQRPVRLAAIRVVHVSREQLRLCTTADAAREGFPHLTGDQFVSMFCREMKCQRRQLVTRIEFEYVD